MDELLLIPGPTQVPQQVREVMTRQMINHRGPAFSEMYAEIQRGLRPVFGSREDILIFPSAGTGMMEAALVNLFSPGDRILVAIMGEFGSRFAAIAEAFGLEVDRLKVEPGEAVEPERLAAFLDEGGPERYRAVLVTHNETSTGVTLDLRGAADVVKERGLLLVVDAVSALGGIEVHCDDWGIDVLITGSQKALMTPPGLGFAYVSPQAWEAVESAGLPRYYWDFRRARKSGANGQTPYTPAVGLWFGLREALKLINEETLEGVYGRHRLMASAFRGGARALGLDLLAADAVASPVVTAVKAPQGLDASGIIKGLRGNEKVVVAGGQGDLKGRIFRVAHMGGVRPEHMINVLGAIERVLAGLGVSVTTGAGVETARKTYDAAAVKGA